MEPMGYNPGVSNTFFAVMIGYLANMALPRLGEVTRCGVLNKYEKIPMNKAIGTVVVERSIDMVVFILLFFFNLFIFFDKLHHYVEEKVYQPMAEKFNLSEESTTYLYVFLIFFGLMIGLFFLVRKRIRHLKFYQKSKEIGIGFWHGLVAVTKIKNRWPLFFNPYSSGCCIT